MISITITSAIVGYNIDLSKRNEYKFTRIKEIGIEKTQDILKIFLPAFVSKRVKDGARYIAEDQGTVTILFCDICDFEVICSEYKPFELTSFLDDLFLEFDQLCTVMGMTKIETVGKTYMACGGLKDSELDIDSNLREISHGRRAVELSLAMISHVKTIVLKNGSELQIKIGINSGPVTAGVVGHHKPQFSLVGDTVNTASRMCSTLENPNSVQISKETYKSLEFYSGLLFEDNEIEAKGKGILKTYIVNELIGDYGYVSAAMKSNLESKSSNSLSLVDISSEFVYSESALISRTTRYSTILDHFQLDRPKDVFLRKFTGRLAKVKVFDCSLNETKQQKEFRIGKLTNTLKMMNLITFISIFNYSFLLLASLLMYFYYETCQSVTIVIGRIIIFFLLLAIMFLKQKFFLRRSLRVLKLLSYAIMSIISILQYYFCDPFTNNLVPLEIMYISLMINHNSGVRIASLV